MFDLPKELDAVRAELARERIEYAICGGIAMAVHGFTRATEDIDLLIRPEDWARLKTAVAGLGFKFEAHPKIDPTDGDVLMLDLLLVTAASEEVWRNRQLLEWRREAVWVVSRKGLITPKRFRSSDQDLVDIRKLEAADESD